MKYLKLMLAIIGLASVLGFSSTAMAQTATLGSAAPTVDRSRAGDEVCTKCHDESETKPILSIPKPNQNQYYKTKTSKPRVLVLVHA